MIKKANVTFYGLILLSLIVGLTLDFYLGINFTDISFPLADTYSNTDGRMTIALFKMILSGEYVFSDVASSIFLSAPFEFKAYDFPMPMFSAWLYIKILGVFTSNAISVFNLFIISTFFLNAFTMFIVLRKLRINLFIAVAIAYLFTFLPFHYFRFGHTFYLGYFFIPLWIYYLLLLHNKKPLFFKKRIDSTKYSFDYSKKNLGIIFILVLSSTWNFYYTFFFVFLIFFILISSYLYHKNRYHTYSALLVFSFAIAPFVLNMVPYKIYEHSYGKNLNVAQRNPIESEIYGLKITQLVFPVSNHHSEKMARLKEGYNQNTLLFNESQDSTLGLIASIGFILLIFVVFFQNSFPKTLGRLSQLNLFALLLSTVGGFGVVFAYLVTPQIRAYNRISVFIAALAFIALAIVINKTVNKSRHKNILFFLLALAIGIFGIWDQTPSGAKLGTWGNSKLEFVSDKNFVKYIENTFDSKQNIQIAQFPYMPYPENGPINQMRDYEQIYGYLHSDKIKWSYGAVKSREADYWYKDLFIKPLNLQVKTLEEAGFSGLVINRNGYADNAQKIEKSLIGLLQVTPIVSDNKQLSFFKLHPRGHKIIMPPIFNSFYEWEGVPGIFRWAGDNANILWINNEAKAKEQTISFEMGSLTPRSMRIKLNGEELESFTITPGVPSPHRYTVKLVPGRNTIEFLTPEPSVKPGGLDTRNLSFSMAKFYAVEIQNQ